MRTDPDRVSEIRRALNDPAKLCTALGVEKGAQRQASGLTIFCPWHEERTPSCSVTCAADGTVRLKCFGCNVTGDALTLIAQVCGLDPRREFRGVLAAAATIAGLHGVRHDLEAPRPTTSIDDATYHALATELVERCPFDGEADVLGYLDRRVLIVMGAQARLFALPAREKQGALLAELAKRFDPETIAAAGFVRRDDDGRPRLDRFCWPLHRLGIPWRSVDGTIATIQRRRIDGGTDRKYVFPRGRAPRLPFGAECLAKACAETQILFCEGALDVLALRLLAWRDRLDVIPLGIPGIENWRAEWARFAGGRLAIVALDADKAGDSKRGVLVRDLYQAGARDVNRWTPKGARDWAELVEQGAS
jgi:DNA primase